MTNRQSQQASDGSTAIQASGDVNIGLSSGQVVEILDAISRQVSRYSESASQMIEERLARFNESLVERFAKDGGGRTEAFADPDFQAALLDAQKAYARSGDEGLHGILVDLIHERSKQDKRNRLTLTLNDAIKKSASITDEDFAILSLLFIMKSASGRCGNLVALAKFFKMYVDPVIKLVPSGGIAFSYLESHGCLTTSAIQHVASYYDHLKDIYPGVITKGITGEQMDRLIPPDHALRDKLVFRSEFDPERFVLVSGDQITLDDLAANSKNNLPEHLGRSYIGMSKENIPSEQEFRKVFVNLYENNPMLFGLFESSPISTAYLTSLGIALAHANLARLAGARMGELGIWIK